MQERSFIAGMIGNILEHYDTALFGLLAPFIAAQFFHDQDPFTALILTYAMIPLGMLSRPLGALSFGWISDRFGRAKALSWSLSGMAAATIGIGFLPTSCAISPLLLAIMRMIQSFFAAGESSGGAIYILENTNVPKQSLISSLFDASTVGGILLASALVTFFSMQGWVEAGWRYLFWAGGATAIMGIFIRMKTKEGETPSSVPFQLKEIFQYKEAFLAIVLASGFGYTTYSLAFTLMNGYIPLVTSLSQGNVMKINTALLVLDFFLLPLFGFFAQKFGKERVMFLGALALTIGATPLFSILGPTSSLWVVTGIRMFIVIGGVAFAAPYHAWALEQVPPRCRSTILCLGYTIGTQVIGTPTAAICLWAYKITGWIAAPSLYLLLTAIGALISLRMTEKKRHVGYNTRSS
jgi:MFS transporter, MHS family, proline/betaine transporter